MCGRYYVEGNDKEERIIVVAESTIQNYCNNKIFISKRTKSHLEIIDSSTSFCFIKGCNVEVKNETIILNSLVHNSGYSFIYKFDPNHQKYLLQYIRYFEITFDDSMDHYHQKEKTYNLLKHILTTQTSYKSTRQKTVKNKTI